MDKGVNTLAGEDSNGSATGEGVNTVAGEDSNGSDIGD